MVKSSDTVLIIGGGVVGDYHVMIGMSLGPITGKLVSQFACHETPAIDISLLSASRF